MNKRNKTLSLILSVGIVASAFPSSGTGATSDSIAFFNSKKTILEMKEYDEAYDTNHDGVVNVFDVIRENKEVFQEESYTDLKSQIHSLETQIEILTQKLTEKEDKAQAKSDLSEIKEALAEKANQQGDKQLSSNDYTNEEKQKLESLNNYDDTSIKSDISEISSQLSGKVNIQDGKQLSSNDYTDEDKNKLASLENYNDNDIKSEISTINSELSSINYSLSGKVDYQEGKQLSSNDYTDSDKEKLKNLENYDDTKINDKIDLLVQTAYEEKKEIEVSIENKVDKEDGKYLSSNDYTDEEKHKLEELYNYDDSKLKSEIEQIENEMRTEGGENPDFYDLNDAPVSNKVYRISAEYYQNTPVQSGFGLFLTYSYDDNKQDISYQKYIEISENGIFNIYERSRYIASQPWGLWKKIKHETEDEISGNVNLCAFIKKWGFIGDSLTEGQIVTNAPSTDTELIPAYSWGKQVEYILNSNSTIWGSSGNTAKGIYEMFIDGESSLITDKRQVYVYCIGQNDVWAIENTELYDNSLNEGYGDISSININNYNLNENTFVGWTAKMIQRVKSENPDCVFILMNTMLNNNRRDKATQALKDVSETLDDVLFFDNTNYYYLWEECDYGHLTARGYYTVAETMLKWLSLQISDNPKMFSKIVNIE